MPRKPFRPNEKTAQKIIKAAEANCDVKQVAHIVSLTPFTVREYIKNHEGVKNAFNPDFLDPRKKKKIEISDVVLQQIEQLAVSGRNLKQIATILGIGENTFKSYRDNDSRIDDVYNRGKEKAHANVGTALYKGAVQGQLGHIRWYEMTRCGFAEKSESKAEVTEVPYVVELPPDLDSEEWKKEYGNE